MGGHLILRPLTRGAEQLDVQISRHAGNMHYAHRAVKSKCTSKMCILLTMKIDDRPESAKRLEQARIAKGFKTPKDAARFFGWSYETYIQHEQGTRGITRQSGKYAKALNVSEGWLLTGEGDGPVRTLPLVGYVGAGAEIFTIDDHAKGAGLEEVEMPPGGASSNTIAVRVRGDSMVPAYEDGDIIYYDDKVEGDFSSMIGKRCLVKLADGRMFIKKLMRSNGTYWLYSHNAEPIMNPDIVWVAKVLWAKQD